MMETKSGKRLLPLVQLLPAVAVAGLVLVTVPRTAPVLAAVPERLAEAASEPAAEPAASSEEEAEGLTAVLPYADGVYTGSSRGFGGTVQVRVTVAADGSVDRLALAQTSGNRELDRAALEAVRRWRFQPATRDGQPVVAEVIVPLDFAPQR